jgi:hypothetical protein
MGGRQERSQLLPDQSGNDLRLTVEIGIGWSEA